MGGLGAKRALGFGQRSYAQEYCGSHTRIIQMNGSFFRLLASIGAISGVFIVAACRQVAAAEEAKKQPSADAAKDEVKTAHFVLHPAEPPHAALKYRLLPSGIEQTPGNAAPHYFRAAMVWTGEKA